MTAKEAIRQGKTALGIEFGSTRIKAVLIDGAGKVLAVGIYDIDQQCARIADQRLRRWLDPVVLLPTRHYSSAA